MRELVNKEFVVEASGVYLKNILNIYIFSGQVANNVWTQECNGGRGVASWISCSDEMTVPAPCTVSAPKYSINIVEFGTNNR